MDDAQNTQNGPPAEASFGNWVRRRRKALDLTQEELARQVGCSTSAIFKIEADERRPSRQVADLLAIQLDIPAAQRELFVRVARQEKSTPSLTAIPQLPAYPAPAAPRSSLPAFATPFVGREHEVEMVERQLLDPACRLLTLTGPGGVGKTRLAVAVARRLEARYPGRVYFLPMAGVNSPESLLPAIAGALGLVFSGPADPAVQVLNHLRQQEALLLFDNMEHLIEAGGLLAQILEAAPGVKLLATSRESLRLQWEWLFSVQGLPVPETASPTVLENNSAVLLFLQRARQSAQDFVLSAEEAAALVRVCKVVDGLPLAIELAASWVRVMSLREIAEELDRGLDLLETSMQDVPARHRSMRTVLDQSWGLLAPDEQAALMALAIFPGGFTRPAAETVAGASLRLLSTLVGKSLLRYHKKTDRYDFHELVRQFAAAQLHAQPEQEHAAYDLFTQYYGDWIRSVETGLKSAQQIEVAARIRAEAPNWIAAWRRAVDQRRLEIIKMMLPCISWYFEIHGYNEEALATNQYAVDALRAGGAPGSLETPQQIATFAELINQHGWFEFRTGSIERAIPLFEESLALACGLPEAQRDLEGLYYIHINWGYLAVTTGQPELAREMVLLSLEDARRLGSPWHIAIPVTILGIIDYQQGNLQESYRQLSESLTVWRSVGDLRGLVFCMLYLSETALALGEISTAEALLHESNAIATEKTDRWAQSFGLYLLGRAAMQSEDYAQALEHFQQAAEFSQEIGDHWASTQAVLGQGAAQALLGERAAARRLLLDAYQHARGAGWTPSILAGMVAAFDLADMLPDEERLAAALAVLAHPAATPALRREAGLVRDRLAARLEASGLPADGLDAAVQLAGERSALEWAEVIFGLLENSQQGP